MSTDERTTWTHQDGDRYLPIACTAWMNHDGSGVHYQALAKSTSHTFAMHQGFAHAGSDDFNIGVLRKGHLVALLWMRRVVDDDPAVLAGIAEQLGLEVSP